jgi:hypothetical protein
MSYPNGQIPDSELATTYLYYPGTANGRRLLKSVAPYAEAMATAFYLHFGKPMYATDGYRDLATQWVVWRRYLNGGAPAAIPGTSNHGKGEALDLASNINSFSSAEHKWVRENEAKYGWTHPEWARQGNGREEAWHHEFVGGGTSSGRILRARTGLGEVGLGHTDRAKVREIQERLNFHLPTVQHVVVDGDFGLATAIAVIRFQKLRRVYVSGRVSLLLLARLRRDVDSTRYERALRRLRERRARAKARLERAN